MAKILLIDDSTFQRKCMSRMLVGVGHEVSQAENGEMGLQMLDAFVPDMIITDLLMPVVDGIGVLRGLNEKNCPIPVVVVTADIQESTKRECLQLGAKAFLNKPHNSDDLRAVLDKFLNPKAREKAKC